MAPSILKVGKFDKNDILFTLLSYVPVCDQIFNIFERKRIFNPTSLSSILWHS